MNRDYERLLKSLEEVQLQSKLCSLKFLNQVAIFTDETASLRMREIGLYEDLEENGYNLGFKAPFFNKIETLITLGDRIHNHIKNSRSSFRDEHGLLISEIPPELKLEIDGLLNHHMSKRKTTSIGYGELRSIMIFSPSNQSIVTKDGRFLSDLSGRKTRFYSEIIVNNEGWFEESRFDLDLKSDKFGNRRVSTQDLEDVVFCKWINITDASGNSISKDQHVALTRFLLDVSNSYDIEELLSEYSFCLNSKGKVRLNLQDYGITSYSEERHNKGRDSTTTSCYNQSPSGLTLGHGLLYNGLEMLLNGRTFLDDLRNSQFQS